MKSWSNEKNIAKRNVEALKRKRKKYIHNSDEKEGKGDEKEGVRKEWRIGQTGNEKKKRKGYRRKRVRGKTNEREEGKGSEGRGEGA